MTQKNALQWLDELDRKAREPRQLIRDLKHHLEIMTEVARQHMTKLDDRGDMGDLGMCISNAEDVLERARDIDPPAPTKTIQQER